MTATDLQMIRTSLGLKIADMARALKVRPETVWRWEHGSVPISQKAARRIYDLAEIKTCPSCGQPVK